MPITHQREFRGLLLGPGTPYIVTSEEGLLPCATLGCAPELASCMNRGRGRLRRSVKVQAEDLQVLDVLQRASEDYDAYLAIVSKDLTEILQSGYDVTDRESVEEPMGIELDENPLGIVLTE
jgi:hypothetical protein